jgi:hypothetical protein
MRVTGMILLALACLSESSQDASDRELELLLANTDTRQRAISEITASGESRVPLLLSWAKSPPAGLNPLEVNQLNMAMAEAFGRNKTKEAIRFLIRNISLDRSPITDVWTRTPEAILSRLPAVAALILIGPDASRAIIETSPSEMPAWDHLAAVFVVSRVPDVAQAREYLTSALGEANMLRARTEEGLQFLESHQ